MTSCSCVGHLRARRTRPRVGCGWMRTWLTAVCGARWWPRRRLKPRLTSGSTGPAPGAARNCSARCSRDCSTSRPVTSTTSRLRLKSRPTLVRMPKTLPSRRPFRAVLITWGSRFIVQYVDRSFLLRTSRFWSTGDRTNPHDLGKLSMVVSPFPDNSTNEDVILQAPPHDWNSGPRTLFVEAFLEMFHSIRCRRSLPKDCIRMTCLITSWRLPLPGKILGIDTKMNNSCKYFLNGWLR